MILAGDIGATKTGLGLFSREGGPARPILQATFSSRGSSSLEEIALRFLKDAGAVTIKAASFGIAGPVRSGRVDATNLPWTLDAGSLGNALGVAKVRLMNDTQALAFGLSLLGSGDLKTLNAGSPEPLGVRAVLASGTGLGEAFLTCGEGRLTAHATEGGHADFAAADEEQIDLLRFLADRFGHVSWERACSGIGIENLAQFLFQTGKFDRPAWWERAGKNGSITPELINEAMEDPAPSALSLRALELFCAILGAEAGNMALSLMATGGVYLGGGLPPRILPFLEKGFFMKAFLAKGRMAGIAKEIPVHVVLNPETALLGAAVEGLSMVEAD
ncbi:MAG: glucokinase [Proteobacteria bacterium]|nr:glucokinase [Pseudomonadota bacterium]